MADLYDARKRARQNLPLPRQIVLQYAWREEVLLDGARFGEFAGRVTTMLCGGTLVFNENGNVLSWMMKPGLAAVRRPAQPRRQDRRGLGGRGGRGRGPAAELLDYIAARIAAGRVGTWSARRPGCSASWCRR